ncbi:MAG: sugar phosphate isomerase/epimerase [Bryobacterales bacterium]|nr:sugar phosphate isomerase/epimerase [Bryobacterales bacterium]
MFHLGLNPYGLTYYLGLQGRGTPRANPAGRGLEGFIEIASQLNAKTIELHNSWITELTPAAAQSVRQRIAALGMTPVISLGPPLEGLDTAIRSALAVDAKTIRLGLSPVLCGDRNACGPHWREFIANARHNLQTYAPQAAALGLVLAIENHQDFGSQELLDFCVESGPNVGICIDTGNPLAVGEAPLEFARRVAPLVRHVHLKDYNAQWTNEGYRLVRCAIGDGAVPFQELAAILAQHHQTLTASLEPGALEARHVRLFRPEWWNGYPSRTAAQLGPCLAAARLRRLPDDADYRTPWERGDSAETIVQYELDMIHRSAANMKSLGWM